ncbi:Alcohol dehydrogenase superfamily, zinc-type [Ostreococcus tauri]|uniref:Alcohol dehydrogenase superfamily, zinc-type n=1 Tax=Ostreococcus tauri TaxID=70448 RepID=A0A454XYS0_OSTTA|nr:Alcohol dehydrogenase superfamily, zinc-type [Ostreococcus tauri]OUS48898.1 putative NADP-dependent alcohol dehydrogenase [Ostreococcus tauri]OUS49055.1 putative NADP-dependent alcohol dehydrogenase [Ostreococcus tauri]CAL55397.1 Alcohol dehydrogenase superfamily, zinc-type [Ostreococcus tauri]|eukprot:XP_003081228.1 Alcohol dehydrogenase superfamily, zinc-type [Ostreococcus tauri]
MDVMNPKEPMEFVCMACDDARCHFKPLHAHRRPLGDRDVLITLKFCGVCHSDLHNAGGHMAGVMGPPKYPFVPGHELAGIVVAVGSAVTMFSVGDRAGVGCIVDSCLKCVKCEAGEEQMCVNKMTGTYGSDDKHGRAATWPPGGQTLGGYATFHVVDERFGVKIPATYPLEAAGPVMCAGVTMYDPMKRYGVKRGSKVGIVGLGGLGVMGAKIARALGAEVTVISRSATKETLALRCGATNFVCSEDKEDMRRARGTLDLILNTVPIAHDYFRFQKLLKHSGGEDGQRAKQVILGLHSGLATGMVALGLKGKKTPLAASGIGGIRATQEVMDLCAAHDIVPEYRVVPVSQLTEIYEELDSGNDSGIRYVLDIASMAQAVKEGNEESLCTSGPPQLSPSRSSLNGQGIIGEIAKLFCCCYIC